MLNDCYFLHSYTSGFDEPKEFFTEALIESKYFDLGLGFFSSSGIRSLAYGFALFIANGGKMRVVINDILSPEDKAAIEKGQFDYIDSFEEMIISDIRRLSEILSKEDEQFFNCLSYLISIKRIEFVATLSAKGGLAHDKYGIFTDANGYKVAFIGSANFSKNALELNGETITVFTSNEDDARINEYQSLFNDSWEKDNAHLIHIPIEKVKTVLQEEYQVHDIHNLISQESYLREAINNSDKPFSERLCEKLEEKEQEPRFPFPEERSIQSDAYKAWLKNNKNGIFAMATGSGKTVTALNCILKQYFQNGYYKAIVVVPTQALAIQWEKEALAFNFQNIISSHTSKNWKNDLCRYSTRSLINQQVNILFITTYATFTRRTVQDFLCQTKGIEDFVFVADEAHNLGSAGMLAHLPFVIHNRIGLSATPERVYDESGTKKIYEFFNSYPPEYTFKFTMKQAIDSDILCHYTYTPVFVELTRNEMDEYERITTQLRKFIDPDTGHYSEDAELLLLKRKRIIHKAENKKIAIARLLDGLRQEQSLAYTFVFVPEGYEKRDYSLNDSYSIDRDDIHIIDEYSEMFKSRGYSYHKYISGLDDAPAILKSFAAGDIKILLSMKCLDEGVDIPRAEYAIFCSSTGNPRQFVQRRGRVLRKCKGKEKATIWDLVVLPPEVSEASSEADKNLFISEVKRIVNFAALADNQIDVLYGELKGICEQLRIPLFEMLEEEYKQYN